jgi:CheY-like chemotaxis protein
VTRRVLLVDDDIAEIAAVKRALLKAGAQAQLATCSTDALAALGVERPALVIVASDCENGEGLELARQLAAGESTRDLPLLLLGEPEEPAPARFLPRPIDPARLAEDLAVLLDGPGPAAPPPPRPEDVAERHRAAEALRARAEELRRADAEERARREAEAQQRREEEDREARHQAEEELRRALAATEAEEALRLLAEEVDAEAPAQAPAEAPAQAPAEAPAQAPAEAPAQGRAEAPADPEEDEAARGEAAPPAASGGRKAIPAGPPSGRPAGGPDRAGPAPEEEARRRAASARARRAEAPPPPEAAAPPRSPAAGLRPPETKPEPRHGEAEAARAAAAGPAPAVPMELAAGSLDRTSVARLLALAARRRLTGRLDFAGGTPRSLYFEDGRIVGATSAAPGERVEEVALRLGLVTREQHRQAAPACAGLPTRRAALALLERGFLRAEELTGLVRRRTEEVVFALFDERGATWRCAAARAPPEERTALDRSPLALAIEGVRRRWQEDRLGETLGGPATLLAPAAGGPSAAELSLGEAGRLLELADGLRTLDEIAADGRLDPLSARQVLAALVEVGALEVRIRGAGPSTAGGADPSVDLLRLQEKLEQVRRADYFTILGLSRTATPYEIRAGAERLLADLGAGRWAGVSDPGVRERLDEVRRVVSEARDVLTDDELRAAYLQGLQ